MSRFDKRDMEYFAHTNDNGCRQPLKEHLEGVAGYARDFSVPGLKDCAYLAGLTHDLGKYSREFQARLSGSCIAVDHSTYGAQVVCDKFGNSVLGMLFAYVYYRTGSLKLTMLMHCTNNTFAALLGQNDALREMSSYSEIMTVWQYVTLVSAGVFLTVLFLVILRKNTSVRPSCHIQDDTADNPLP